MQVHIDLLTGLVRLVPTTKTATAETAASNFGFGVPRRRAARGVCIGQRHALHERLLDESARGARGVAHRRLPTPPQHYRVIADVLRSFADDRCDDWPDLVQLVEFAINDSAS